MTWFDNIGDLQYYNAVAGVPCYCEQLIFPTDLLLQGFFEPREGTFSALIEAYSADGLTVYENIAPYFNIYYASDPVTGKMFFNAQMNGWPESICLHKCFIIKATINNTFGSFGVTLFSKFTERYCQSECCDTPRNITIVQEGLEVGVPVVETTTTKKYTDCGDPLIRIISRHNCYDPFANIFYGLPGNIVQGVASFPFEKISTLKGRIVRRPQDITRELSYNCRLQRVESTPQYFIEGYDYLPTWKALEINAQFAAHEIYVDDYVTNKQYQFGGGTPVRQLNSCFELYKLETILQDCPVRKTYGCDTSCGTPNLLGGYQSFFLIPSSFSGNAIYNDDKQLVANDAETLVEWIRTQNGVTDAGEVSFSPAAGCDFYALIGFSGNGILPSSIYYNSTAPANRIYSIGVETASEVCDFVVETCPTPVLSISIEDSTCPTPVLVITFEDNFSDVVEIQQQMPWEIQTQSGYVSAGQVTLSLYVKNFSIIPTMGESVYLNNEIIGVVYANGRPTIPKSITSDNNNIPDGWFISIDEFGIIRFTGEPTQITGSNVEVEFENIVYDI